ncbi:MAG: aromatic prenyltransferase [Pyrinomonadaceae bacterium]
MKERIDPTPYQAERFYQHLRSAAEALGADFSESATKQALEVFDEEFSTCVVQTKAGSKPKTGLYYRFFYKGPNDLTQRAQGAGMIAEGQSPIVTLQNEILTAFPRATRAGLDFDAGFGLAKVWTFTGGPVPFEQFQRVSAIPQSVRDHAAFFAKHDLKDVFFVASDYQKQTMNVYFGWDPLCRTKEWLETMMEETDSFPLSEETCREILESQANSAGVGMTFSWQRPELLRWSLYSLDVPYDQSSDRKVRLPQLPQRLNTFRQQAPTLNESPQFNVAWSFGREGYYLKLEKSYSRDATYFLTCEMGGDLSRSAPKLATVI